jgi:purine-binding chemotaxis protein CheW
MRSALARRGSNLHATVEAAREQYLVFEVCGAEYLLPLLGLVEVVQLGSFAAARPAQPSLGGVVSLRGEAVAVVDLAVLFGEHRSAVGPESCALVASASQGGQPAHVGLGVDAVRGTVALAAAAIAPAPRLGTLVEIELFSGMATLEQRLVPVLDLQRALDTEELQVARTAALASHGQVARAEPAP